VKAMTVGDLRQAIEGVPDDTPVCIEAWAADEVGEGDVLQVALQSCKLEARCDEVEVLYLEGDAEELLCDACMSTTGGKCSAHAEPEPEER
jgi:hypothetical protein